MSSPKDTKDSTAKALAEAKQCYGMSKTWAWVEAMMSNHTLNYRTPEQRLAVKDACFDSVVRTTAPVTTTPEDIERARREARKVVAR